MRRIRPCYVRLVKSNALMSGRALDRQGGRCGGMAVANPVANRRIYYRHHRARAFPLVASARIEHVAVSAQSFATSPDYWRSPAREPTERHTTGGEGSTDRGAAGGSQTGFWSRLGAAIRGADTVDVKEAIASDPSIDQQLEAWNAIRRKRGVRSVTRDDLVDLLEQTT